MKPVSPWKASRMTVRFNGEIPDTIVRAWRYFKIPRINYSSDDKIEKGWPVRVLWLGVVRGDKCVLASIPLDRRVI